MKIFSDLRWNFDFFLHLKTLNKNFVCLFIFLLFFMFFVSISWILNFAPMIRIVTIHLVGENHRGLQYKSNSDEDRRYDEDTTWRNMKPRILRGERRKEKFYRREQRIFFSKCQCLIFFFDFERNFSFVETFAMKKVMILQSLKWDYLNYHAAIINHY